MKTAVDQKGKLNLPISTEEYGLAVHFIGKGACLLVQAKNILDRFSRHGLIGEGDDRLDRCSDEIAQFKRKIADVEIFRRRLQKQAKRKKEIDAERRRAKSK
jgi:hypothetical protein